MTSITLTLTGAKARASVSGPLTSGMIGIPVTIEYDEAWSGLTKNLVCRCGKWGPDTGETRTVLNVEESTTVAHEVMKEDMNLYLGVAGYSADGKLVIPTTWADCGKILPGANADADPSASPKLSIWGQLQREINQLTVPTLKEEQIAALGNMFKVCAFTKADVSAEYKAFQTAFGITDSGEVEPDEPDVPDVPDVPVDPDAPIYTITNNLTNCVSNNSTASIVEGGSYTATLTADDGYTLEGATISVVVNGEDVTDTAYSNGVITIPSVTGNVVITAVAVEEASSGEVVMLASITGDGASWIDTEVDPHSLGFDQLYEFSLAIPEFTNSATYNVFGADGFNVGTSYGRVLCGTSSNQMVMKAHSAHNMNAVWSGGEDSDGFWNSTAEPTLRSEQAWYKASVTTEGVLCATYKDEGMSKIPTSANENITAFTTFTDNAVDILPIIPMYLFHVNTTELSSMNGKYTPSAIRMYYFRIKKASTGELLHEYLPAKQGNKVGMYDTVEQKFHENKGTGTFSYEEVSA